jgi:hypothetical protein
MKTMVFRWLFVIVAAVVCQSVEAAPHTGTWAGELSSGTGEKSQFALEFSEAGFPVVRYETKSGPQAAELSAPGQEFRRAVPGGGIETMVVKELSITAAAIHYVVSVSFEKTTGNTLEQQYVTMQWDLAPRGDAMSGQVTISMRSAIGQPGAVLADPDAKVSVFRGTLTRK